MMAEQTDAQNLWDSRYQKHLYAISLLNHEHENQKISDYIESLTHSSQLKFLCAFARMTSERCFQPLSAKM